MKETKRKAFNFLRSYFDVLNELKEDSDRLNFLMSIINKQFLNQDPKDLDFIAKLCYESQRHAIESSVKGWIRANKTDLQGNLLTNPPTNPPIDPPTNPKEEEEKEEEEEQVEEKVKVIVENKFSPEVLNCYDALINFFPIQLQPEKKESWYSEIEKLNRIDKIPFELIIGIVKKTREDAFWSKNFLSLTKLRKKNKDGLKYIVVFNEKFNSVPQQEQKVGRQTLSTIEQNTKGWK